MSNLDIVKRLYAAFGEGDVPAVLSSFDASIAWREAEGNPYQPSGEPWIGPDAVLENLFVKLGEDWDDFTVHQESFHDAGGVVVMEGRYTATFKATGKSLDAQVCHVWALQDGKVTSFQQYADTAQLQRVMAV